MLEKISHLIQAVSGIVLVVGVVLVLLQMQQTERLTRTQLTSSYFDSQIAQAASATGEDPMESFEKLCDEGAEITLKDSLILHNLFLQRYFLAMKSIAIEQQGEFGVNEQAMQLFVNNLGLVIVTPQGRAWLESIQMSEEQREAIKTSPYYESTCSDLGPASAVLRADQLLKGGGT